MPGTRGVKRTASKASSTAAAVLPKNKKKRVAPVQLEIPTLSKRKGRVLTCGQGDVGQLGLGEDVMETTRFKHVSDLKDNIVEVVAGGMHTVCLDSDGNVWTFGCNDEGALGRGGEESRPAPVPLPGPARALAAGDSHSAALLRDGRVLAWGAFRDSHGRMGLLAPGKCSEPAALPLPEPAAALASGQDHLVLLTVGGSVYTLGCGEQGQLGRLSQRSASRDTRQGFSPLLTPARVALKGSVSRVWAGYHATFVQDAAGVVRAWGLNNYNQLGISGEKRRGALFSPVECDALNAASSSWLHIAAGQHHSVALDHQGNVYTVGRCEYGRLGLGAGCADAEQLSAVGALRGRRCVRVAAGTANSFAVTADGVLYGWGMGSEGQLGTGGSRDADEPAPADTRNYPQHRAVAVAAGGQHTVLLAVSSSAAESPEREDKESEQQAEETAPRDTKPAVSKRGGRKQQKEASSNPEAEPSETSEEAPPTAARPKRKNEQEEASQTGKKKQKVNGDDNKEKDAAMEVDETDKPDEPTTEKMDDAATTDDTTDSKPDVTSDDASSQDSADQQQPGQDQQQPKQDQQQPGKDQQPPEHDQQQATDVHMKDAALNGAPDTVPTKKPEVQSANVVTTVA